MKTDRTQILVEWGDAAPCAVTVAVSLYNYADYIAACLDSVAAQSFSDLELVVVDDCSAKNDSARRARKWMEVNRARFRRGKLIQHTSNLGLAEARNTAFAAASAEFVFVLDADNTIYPRCIEKLHRAIPPGADAAYSQLEMFGDVSETGWADYWSKDMLARGPYIDAMALVARPAWQRVGGYTHLDGGWEDYDFWCKLAEQGGQACYVPEMLGRYRVHQSSMLRTDSIKSYDRLYNLISLRHPWTRLQGHGGTV